MISLAQSVSDSRDDLPTTLGTADLRKLGNDILRQSLFSARMNNASAVQALREAIAAILQGKDNVAEQRLKLKQLGEALGYDPAKGFPGTAEGAVPAADAGSRLDLFSTDRLSFILKTQLMMTQGAAKNIWGNTPDALEQYPAWELIRVAAREVPRGEIRRKGVLESDPENAWDTDNGRWQAALDASGDDEAQTIFDNTGRMIAAKDSDVWAELGDGAGGYEDTLGNDYEPYAFNSGMGRVEISRQEFMDLGGDPDGVEADQTDFGSSEVQVNKDRFDPDILQTLKNALDSGDLKFRVKLTV